MAIGKSTGSASRSSCAAHFRAAEAARTANEMLRMLAAQERGAWFTSRRQCQSQGLCFRRTTATVAT